MRETEEAVLQLLVKERGVVEIVVPGEGRIVLDEEGLSACRELAEKQVRSLDPAAGKRAAPAPARAPDAGDHTGAGTGTGTGIARSLVWLLGAVLVAVILGSFWALGRGVSYDEIVPVVARIESFVDEVLEGTLGGLVGAAVAYFFLRRRMGSD